MKKNIWDQCCLQMLKLGNISNGLALQCAVEFTQHLEPLIKSTKLKSEINAQLSKSLKRKI